MRKLGIIVALPGEKKTLSKAYKKIIKSGRVNISIQLAGMGPDNAASAAHKLLSLGCKALLSWGCAAALAQKLLPGDCLIPKSVISEELMTSIDVDNLWHQNVYERLSPKVRVYTDPLAGSSELVSGAAEKVALGERTGAYGLDMESAAIAKVANEFNVPFVAIRCIADPASMNLPDSVAIAMNDTGELNIAKLIMHTLIHPSNIDGLIQLASNFKAAQNSLVQSAHLMYPDFCLNEI